MKKAWKAQKKALHARLALAVEQINTLDAAGACKAQDEDARLPDRDELASMFVNSKLMGVSVADYWSGSIITPGPSGQAWHVGIHHGLRTYYPRSRAFNVRCIKK